MGSHDSERSEILRGSLWGLPTFSKGSHREDDKGRKAVGGQRATVLVAVTVNTLWGPGAWAS